MLVGGMCHPTTMLGTTMGPLTTEVVPLHAGANGAPRSKFAYPKLYNSHCALGLGVGLECELWNMGATCKDAAGGGIRCNFIYSTHSCKFLLLFMTPLNQTGHKLSKNYKLAADGTEMARFRTKIASEFKFKLSL